MLGQRGGIAASRAALRDQFHEGLQRYRAGEWELADRAFQECLRLDPTDVPSRLFVERVADFRQSSPAAPWDGVWTLTHK